MKQTEQSKLAYCISLVKRLPDFEERKTLVFEGWKIMYEPGIGYSEALRIECDGYAKKLWIDGNSMIENLILTSLIADLEGHLGIRSDKVVTYELYKECDSRVIPVTDDEWQHIFSGIINNESIFQMDNDTYKIKLVELTGSEGKGGEE